MRLSSLSSLVLVGSAVLAAGCDRKVDVQATTHVTSAPASAAPVNPASVETLARTRCDREQRCDNVGNGKRYENADACLDDFRGKGNNELTTAACPQGIDAAKLQTCLDEIRTERCDNPLDTVGRITACRTAALCPAAAAPQD